MNWIKKIFDRIGAPVGASISVDVAGVKTVADAVQAKTDYLQDLEDGVYFDSVTGGAGTDWPVGTAQSPSNVIASVITMCTARKTKKIYVNGSVTLGATMEGHTFIGINKSATITLNSQDVDTSHFYNCTVTGAQGGTGYMYLHNCVITAVTGFAAYSYNCDFTTAAETITPRSSSSSYIINGSSLSAEGAFATIDFNGLSSTLVSLHGIKGFWSIKRSTDAGNSIVFSGNGAGLGSQASNTLGSIEIYGDTIYSSDGGGITESDYTMWSRIGAPAGASVSADIADIESKVDDLETLNATTAAGKTQMKVVTVDLYTGAGAHTSDIATCSTQDIVVDSIVLTPAVDISDDATITGISVQDDDTTPHVFIDSTAGAKANLTQYAQLAWAGSVVVRVGKKIQVSVIGGDPDADPTNCTFYVTYHAVVAGGTL